MNSSFGNDSIVETNNWSGFAEQGLVRFGDLFGSGAGQIPAGSTITNASLSVFVSHRNDTEPASVVGLYKVNANWTESSTWNSLTGGIQTNGTEAAAMASDTISATNSGWVTFKNLASDVQQWVDGQPNYGWSLLTNDSDAWEFNSSENGNVSLRPYLTIAYGCMIWRHRERQLSGTSIIKQLLNAFATTSSRAIDVGSNILQDMTAIRPSNSWQCIWPVTRQHSRS